MLQLSKGPGGRVHGGGRRDAAALEVLSELGCDFAQGYYIGYPMKEPELEAWIQAHEAGQARDARPVATGDVLSGAVEHAPAVLPVGHVLVHDRVEPRVVAALDRGARARER